MDRFKRINWHPALEDMIDTVFVRDERMERESAMYRILSDSFTDPFEGIEEDYAKVDIKLIKRLGGKELEEEVQREIGAQRVSAESDKIKTERDRTKTQDGVKSDGQNKYIPGIRKLPFYFPRRSLLSKHQQAICLRVLLQFSSNEKRSLTETEKSELQTYMSLQETISQEQAEFLKFAQSKWNETANLFMKCPGFLNAKWTRKIRRVQRLPKHYVECTNIPISLKKDVRVKFVMCLKQELLPEIKLPNLDKRKLLDVTTVLLLKRFKIYGNNNAKAPYVLSEDTHCEDLAVKTKVDLVISFSGLKCLLNNIDPTYSNSWFLPVVIKSHNGKNVIYVDKRLPPLIATAPEKNTWIYKYILRYHFVDTKDTSPEQAKQDTLEKDAACPNPDKFEDSFDKLKIAERQDIRKRKSKPDEAGCSEDGEYSESSVEEFEDAPIHKPAKAAAYSYNNIDTDDRSSNSSFGRLKIDEDVCSSSISNEENELHKYDKINTSSEMNEEQASYHLFTIEAQSQDYNERENRKEYKILIRSRVDGVEILPDGRSCPLILSAKLEHQLGFGAEAATLKESLQEWTSLIFRPEATVARVRIEADSAEVIQIERHTIQSVTSEIKRLHNVRPEESLNILYNMIEKLSVLNPGRYILQHTPKHGPFIYVCKQTDNLAKKTLNLKKIYKHSQFTTSPNTPWPPIDKLLTTPWMKHCKKMPAMFNAYVNAVGNPRGFSKKKYKVDQG